jgi:hypothetical protein
MLCALDYALGKRLQIVIAGSPESPDTQALFQAVRKRFLPNAVLVLADGTASQEKLAKRIPFLRGKTSVGGKATAYVCEDFACHLPEDDVSAFERALDAAASVKQ